MWRFVRGACAALVSACAMTAGALAQAVPIVIDDYAEIADHALGPKPMVRTAWVDSPSLLEQTQHYPDWDYDLTVDERGRVIVFKPSYNRRGYPAAADVAASRLRFRPFERDGRPVTVRLQYSIGQQSEDYVGPADRTFPMVSDLAQVTIRLTRTGCFGPCPMYELEVQGDGGVTYRGMGYAVVRGEQHWRIPPENVRQLLDRFRRADYFKLPGYYVPDQANDLPTFITALRIGKTQKYVFDFGGPTVAEYTHVPSALIEIENEIDIATGSNSWTRGDAHTIEALQAANWNFRAPASGDVLGALLRDCKLELARAFLANGTPANSYYSESRGGDLHPVIERAARCDGIDFARELVDHGAVRKPADADAFLLAAAAHDNLDMLRLAVQHVRTANIKDKRGTPVLALAASVEWESRAKMKDAVAAAEAAARGIPWKGKLSPPSPDYSEAVIRALVAAGADPNARDKDGNTPLHTAENANAVRALIAVGADPNGRNPDGRTPLFDQFGVYRKAEPIAALIAGGANVNARDASGQTPLFALSLDEDVLKLLIKAGADVRARDAEGRTALSRQDKPEVIRLLVASGADPNARDRNGRTPLFDQLFAHGVEALVAAGADVNAVDKKGGTALEDASDEDVALALLKAGARVPSEPKRLAALTKRATDKKWEKVLPILRSAR